MTIEIAPCQLKNQKYERQNIIIVTSLAHLVMVPIHDVFMLGLFILDVDIPSFASSETVLCSTFFFQSVWTLQSIYVCISSCFLFLYALCFSYLWKLAFLEGWVGSPACYIQVLVIRGPVYGPQLLLEGSSFHRLSLHFILSLGMKFIPQTALEFRRLSVPVLL